MASKRKKKSAPANKESTAARGAHDAATHVEELDACDLAFDEAETTPDEDLPAAEGGVA